jgi:hypothetical protein
LIAKGRGSGSLGPERVPRRILIATRNNDRWGPISWTLLRRELDRAGLNCTEVFLQAIESDRTLKSDVSLDLCGKRSDAPGRTTSEDASSFDLVLLIGSFDSTNFELVHSGTADKVITPQCVLPESEALELDDPMPVTPERLIILENFLRQLVEAIKQSREDGTELKVVLMALKKLREGTSTLSEIPEGALDAEETLRTYLISEWCKTHFASAWKLVEDTSGRAATEISAGPTGRIDLLAQALRGRDYLVIELKRGVASDDAVAQCMRYMGWVRNHLVSPGGNVYGLIIAAEFDEHATYAAKVVPSLSLCTYSVQVSLKLEDLP